MTVAGRVDAGPGPFAVEDGQATHEARHDALLKGDVEAPHEAQAFAHLLVLPAQGLAPHILALHLGKGGGAVGQGEEGVDGDGAVRRVGAELVAVEGQPGLQAQGVAGAQAHGHGAVLASHLQELLPEGDGRGGRGEELEAHRLAGVPGARDHDIAAAQLQDGHGVAHGLGQAPAIALLVQQGGEDALRLGALEGQHGDLLAAVLQVDVAEAGDVVLQPVPVGGAVGGVDDEHVLLVGGAVQVGVVDGAAAVVGDHGVLGQARLAQLQDVVGEHVLEEGDGIAPGHGEAAHVTDVEEPGTGARGQVLGEDGVVLDGHVEAAELRHARPRLAVPGVEHGPASAVTHFRDPLSDPLRVPVSVQAEAPRVAQALSQRLPRAAADVGVELTALEESGYGSWAIFENGRT